MAKRSLWLGAVPLGAVLIALVLRAVSVHSVNAAPLIYRATANVNDLDMVEGLAPPGRVVELWARQRSFIEGSDDSSDPFTSCTWKNKGNPIRLGVTQADASGMWRLTDLRRSGNTVMIFPSSPGDDRCRGGVYTELLPRACDAESVNCTAWVAPQLNWLNV